MTKIFKDFYFTKIEFQIIKLKLGKFSLVKFLLIKISLGMVNSRLLLGYFFIFKNIHACIVICLYFA